MSQPEQPEQPQQQPPKQSFAMICLRYVLPAAVVIAGIVVMSLGSETELEGGAGIAGAGLAIFAMNWLIRKATDDPARAEEEAAREFFDRHGRWPDEVAGADLAGAVPPPPLAPAPGAVRPPRRREPAIPRTRGH
jgi:hypothetical protein